MNADEVTVRWLKLDFKAVRAEFNNENPQSLELSRLYGSVFYIDYHGYQPGDDGNETYLIIRRLKADMALGVVCSQRKDPENLSVDLIHLLQILFDVAGTSLSLFSFPGSISELYIRIKSIICHGAHANHYLMYGQETHASFDCWLKETLYEHTLRDAVTKNSHKIKDYYYEWGFLRQRRLYHVFLDCLQFLESKEPAAICKLSFTSLKTWHQEDLQVMEEISSDTLEPAAKLECNTDDSESISSNLKTTTGAGVEANVVIDEELISQNSVPFFSYDHSPTVSPPNPSYLIDESREQDDLKPDWHDRNEQLFCTTSENIREKSSPKYYKKQLTEGRSFLESGGFIQPPSLKAFPVPRKGQSLLSFLSTLSESLPDLDRENAHFNVSEALVSAFESMKFHKDIEDIEEVVQKKQFEDLFGITLDGERLLKNVGNVSKNKRIKNAKKQRSNEKTKTALTETSESEAEYWKSRPRHPPVTLRKKTRFTHLGSDGQSESILSTPDGSETDTAISSNDDFDHKKVLAEDIAFSLIKSTNVKQYDFPPASDLQWVIGDSDVPQDLLPLPRSWHASSSETEESSSKKQNSATRLRGTMDWAPPRPQIIFTLHPNPNIGILLETQNSRCAGCGMHVLKKYASTFRYCYYLGRFFCTGCHTMKRARIPQLILHKWDFSLYPVSNFSATLLESLSSDPLYNTLAINPEIIKQNKVRKFRMLRVKMFYLADYLKNCKGASSLYEEFSNSFPDYYTKDVDLYSLQDLISLKFNTGLPLLSKDFVNRSIHHIIHCTLCRQLGFVCEMCRKKDVLFPFQLNKVSRCPKCYTCFHVGCFRSGVSSCPKCVRISQRLLASSVSSDCQLIDDDSIPV